MANDTFQPGDGATYSINGDSYPYTVRRVSPSGKTLWASQDEFRGKPGANSYAQADKVGVFKPVDVPEDRWEKYTLRKDGHFRRVGQNFGFFTKGRSYRQDPSF